jgi:hypothetical protein
MTWGFRAQRRADAFAALLDGPSPAVPAAGDARLLELVGALRAVPEVAPRADFVADLRDRLVAEAATALTPAPGGELDRLRLPVRQPRRERRLAAAVGGLAIVGATAGVAVASQSALPGDSLYPIKRAIESAHADLSVGDGSKGATILSSASDRLHEVRELTQQGGPVDDARVADTLETFSDQATEASDLLLADYAHTGHTSSIVRLHDFASSSLDQLAALEPQVPAEARDELVRAAGTLTTIDSAATQRCPACGGTPITSIPGVLVALTGAAGQLATPSAVHPAGPRPHPQHHAAGHHHGGRHAHGTGTGPGLALPTVDPGQLDPGSVLGAGSDPSAAPSAGAGSHPLQDLTHALTGGGSATPTGQPSLPAVGDVLQGTTDTLDQVLNGVLGPLTGPTPSP